MKKVLLATLFAFAASAFAQGATQEVKPATENNQAAPAPTKEKPAKANANAKKKAPKKKEGQ